jgi:hypothetical protein
MLLKIARDYLGCVLGHSTGAFAQQGFSHGALTFSQLADLPQLQSPPWGRWWQQPARAIVSRQAKNSEPILFSIFRPPLRKLKTIFYTTFGVPISTIC